MDTAKILYVGQLRTNATHTRSGNSLVTDAPVDNNGKGEAFSPTDLLATSLVSCMMTIMGIAANKNDIPFNDAEASMIKVMAADPRRVSEVQIKIQMPRETYSDQQREILERAALNCPVAKSLHPDLVQNVEFIYH